MKEFDEEAVGKQDIVDSPEVTEQENSNGSSGSEAVKIENEAVNEPLNDEKDERNARIVANKISPYLEETTKDETEALADIALLAFKGLRGLSTFGAFLSGTIVCGCLVIPFYPRLMKWFGSGSEAVKEEDNGDS